MRDLGGKEGGDVVVDGGDCVGPTLWKTSQSQGANGGLYSCEIARGVIESLVVVADEMMERGVAWLSHRGFYSLVREGRVFREGKSKQRVFMNATDVAKIFGRGGRHRADFLGGLLVCYRGRMVLKRKCVGERRLVREIRDR